MDRRDAIKKTAWVLGFTVSGSAATAVLHGCAAEGGGDQWTPEFFTEEEKALVNRLSDLILPTTDTPGALDVGVPRFIDQVVGRTYNQEKQLLIRSGLAELEERARDTFETEFLAASADQQLSLVNELAKESAFFLEPRRLSDEEKTKKTFFSRLIELTILGYFTSEEVGEEVLAYDPIPGNYDGCIGMTNGQRAWSL